MEHERDVEPLVFVSQVHEERSDTVSLDDANADENSPYSRAADVNISAWNGFEEDRSKFKQRENHQNNKVPKLDVFAHV